MTTVTENYHINHVKKLCWRSSAKLLLRLHLCSWRLLSRGSYLRRVGNIWWVDKHMGSITCVGPNFVCHVGTWEYLGITKLKCSSNSNMYLRHVSFLCHLSIAEAKTKYVLQIHIWIKGGTCAPPYAWWAARWQHLFSINHVCLLSSLHLQELRLPVFYLVIYKNIYVFLKSTI